MGLGARGNERVEIELEWAGHMEPLRPADVPGSISWSWVDRWKCPVCDRAVFRPRRPGRKRIYCANSCRQYAYRWRRDHLGVDGDDRPVERAVTRDRQHAIRRSDDPVGDTVDGSGRRATACGAIARQVSDDPSIYGHLRLLPDPTRSRSDRSREQESEAPPRACRRCVELRALPTYDLESGLQAAAEFRAEHEVDRKRSAEHRRQRRRRAAERAAAA